MTTCDSASGLAAGQVDLWVVFLDAADTADLRAEYRALLPADERARCDRFLFPEGQRQCLISRVLVRTVLSFYTGHAPTAWTFSTNSHGKPAIATPAEPLLRFNLSHTKGLAVCAVTVGRELGVDVEDLQRRAADAAIAERYFAPEEVALLNGLPPGRYRERFLQLWTLKESFIKAQGKGLAIPLRDFAFSFPGEQPPQIAFRNPNLGVADDWQFAQVRLQDRYLIALAVNAPRAVALTFRMRETTPLRGVLCETTLAPNHVSAWHLDPRGADRDESARHGP